MGPLFNSKSMDIIETYLFLFTDSLVSNLVIVPHTNLVLTSMYAFGAPNIYITSLIAAIAVCCACILNYLLGKALLTIKKPEFSATEGISKQITVFLSTLKTKTYLGYIVGLAAPVPILGSILFTFAGLFSFKLPRILLTCFGSCFFWYLYLFLSQN